ncbi:phenylacetate--CoA ligase family protein [Pseudomonas fluorescens]|uniref:Phenylacetate-coenzyme A ligase n=1 Tax=Pseudomonas fluorescens TaxID=294 RepID=A0A5E6ZGR0_PSEFL|nr:AMP-binding protein [Pseudomonas fluorescens]VVN65650.1 Phenylacetate-coenzyme A ligase [Pseudomonas fluorescens]
MPPELLHPEFETLSEQSIRNLQNGLWEQQWDYVRRTSAFYKEKFGATVDQKITIDDLQTLPFTGKEEVRRSQELSYPFGTYMACSNDKVVRVHRTSGTTGKPLQLANSRRDVDLVSLVGGRAQYSAGLRPSDRVVHCLNYCQWTGGVTDHMTLEEAGAAVVPFGVGNTKLLLDTITDLGVTAISCTPSYPALLEKLLRAEGRNPRDLKLRVGLFGGEAGLDNIEFRAAMEDMWGFSVRNANYGMSEVLSNFASQCDHSNDLHFHGADALFIEILDAQDRSQSIREGTTGELVCTHLAKECQPLVRFKTRDVITVTGTGPCKCGRTGFRFRVTGRTDDMFNVRGINVFPSSVQKAIFSRPDLASGQFRIVLEGSGPWDRIRVKAEAAAGVGEESWEYARKSLEDAIRTFAGATAEVTILPIDSLPRTDGKTALIERKSS